MRTAAIVCLAAAAGAWTLGGCELAADRPAVMKAPTQAVSELVLPTEKTGPTVTEKDFVMNWLVLGPITFGESDFGGGHQQPAADHAFLKGEGNLDGSQQAPPGAAWQEKRFAGNGQDGQVDLDALYNGAEHAAAYAVAWLKCPREVRDAKLCVGSDDYIKVWINGKLVHTYKTERRAGTPDQDVVGGIRLNQGYNRVVVKCVDVVLGWNFYFRLSGAEGRPIAVQAVAGTK